MVDGEMICLIGFDGCNFWALGRLVGWFGGGRV